MTLETIHHPVLLIGSTGFIGSRVAKALRKFHPSLPLAIVGKDLARAEALAHELGNATAVTVDLTRADLGLPGSQQYSAVAIFMKDNSLHSLMFAQDRGIPYMDISSAAFEIGPEVAQYVHRPAASAVLMNSNWLAGTSTLSALYFAKDYTKIRAIRVSALLDTDDIGGAAANDDYNRQTGVLTSALALQDGSWQWLHDDAARHVFRASDGTEHIGQAFSNLDVLSLASTGAQDVRFEFAVGDTPGRKQNGHFSHEIVITIEGVRRDGRSGTFRYEIVHPEGQAPMTAVSAAVGIETLLGIHGRAVSAGLYLPSTLVDSDHAVERLKAAGTTVREVTI